MANNNIYMEKTENGVKIELTDEGFKILQVIAEGASSSMLVNRVLWSSQVPEDKMDEYNQRIKEVNDMVKLIKETKLDD